jgi:hypothetical protein
MLPVTLSLLEARGGKVGWDIVLQAARSRIRSPMVSLEFFTDIILPALGSTQPLTEMRTKDTFWGVKAAGS